MKKGIEKEYYIKVGKRYQKMRYFDFPSIPADGLWIVDQEGRSRNQIAWLEEIPKLNKKTLGALMKYQDKCANKLLDIETNMSVVKTLKGEEIRYIPSASERIKAIFKLLAGEIRYIPSASERIKAIFKLSASERIKAIFKLLAGKV
jgi:hypothetical protein